MCNPTSASADYCRDCNGVGIAPDRGSRGVRCKCQDATLTDTALVEAMECLLALVGTPIARRKLGIGPDDERVRIVRAALASRAAAPVKIHTEHLSPHHAIQGTEEEIQQMKLGLFPKSKG